MKAASHLILLGWLVAAPAVFGTDVKHGEALFASNCQMCHPGGGNVLNPQKMLKGEAFLKAFPKDALIVSTIRNGIPKSVMTPFDKRRLSDDQVSDIVAYLRTLTAKPAQSACQPGRQTKTGAPSPAIPSSKKHKQTTHNPAP